LLIYQLKFNRGESAFGDSAEKNTKIEFMYLLIDIFDILSGEYQGGSTTDEIFRLRKKLTRMTLADTQNKISVEVLEETLE
jgi:hypothetical protein